MTESTSVTIIEEINKSVVSIFGANDLPAEVKQGVDEIMTIVNANKTISELYADELKETMVSTSIFQDICVQMEEHHTPHRKLRQVMLELSSKLDALDNAKNGHKKAIVQTQSLEQEINELQDIYTLLDKQSSIDFDLALRLISVSYTLGSKENQTRVGVVPETILNHASNSPITSSKYIDSVKEKIKVALGNKIVEYEEAERGMKSAQHMVKDAAIKAYQYRKQAEIYRKQVDESGLSYDESELVYYIMFFTSEAERQLRTGDHQIDRGTYKAISQLPKFIRNKVLNNIHYLKQVLSQEFSETGSWWSSDYKFKTDADNFLPKMSRDENGDLFVEGYKVKDYIMMEPIKVMSATDKDKMDN